MSKYIPTITPEQTNKEYEDLLDSLDITDDDFNDFFNSLFPVTNSFRTVMTASADDVSLDNDEMEGTEDADEDFIKAPSFAGILSTSL